MILKKKFVAAKTTAAKDAKIVLSSTVTMHCYITTQRYVEIKCFTKNYSMSTVWFVYYFCFFIVFLSNIVWIKSINRKLFLKNIVNYLLKEKIFQCG